LGTWKAAIIANLIGACIFFWVDRFIFTSKSLGPVWQIEESIACCDCGKIARGYRLVKAKNYDKSQAPPKFRCEQCSIRKTEELKESGIFLD
jgi:hypothetical protein